MDIKPNNRVNTDFSLASMTDIIFQLLIFFMLTSSFVTPAALPVELPSSVEAPVVTPKVRVTITKELDFYVNKEKVKEDNLELKIREALKKSQEPLVVVSIDKANPVEQLVKVASIVNKLKAKVSIATKIEKE